MVSMREDVGSEDVKKCHLYREEKVHRVKQMKAEPYTSGYFMSSDVGALMGEAGLNLACNVSHYPALSLPMTF